VYIKRKIEATILRYIETPEIIAIVGPRQCGKTTLLKHLFESLKDQAVFLTFEDRKALDLFERETEEFVRQYIKPNRYIFIDEFQYAKRGGKTLKFIYDTNPGKKIFVTGSSSVELTVRTLKYLVGRIFSLTLHPFDFEEYLASKDGGILERFKENKISISGGFTTSGSGSIDDVEDIKRNFEDYCAYGGYPRVVLSRDNEEKKEILKNIFNTYFLREVKDILGLIEDYKLSKLIEALATQVGSLIDYNELGKISGLSFVTLKKYIRFLEKTYICFFPRPFYKNKRTEIVKNPKVYFCDSGLRNHAMNDFRPVSKRNDGGHLLENAAAMQIFKSGILPKYWRNKQGSEIDFVLELPASKTAAVEIKQKLEDADMSSKAVKTFRGDYPGTNLFFSYLEGKLNAQEHSAFPVYLMG
jgi:hypothetical protein